jgi:hypothetical protein
MTALDAAPRPTPTEDETRAAQPTERSPWYRRALILLLFAALVVLMLRPTPHTLSNTFSPDLGDPALLTWVLSWDGHALFTDPFHLFDANIYWPHDQTLAYTDSVVVLAPAFGFVRVLGASEVLAFNITLLGLVLLAAVASYSLTRWIIGRTDASILAGIAFAFSAYTFGHIGHLQLLLLGLFPIGFLVLFRCLEERTIRWSVALGATNVAFILGALTYAAVFAVCTIVIVIGYLVAHRFRPGRDLVRPFLIVGAITVIALPFLWPYYDLGVSRAFIPDPGLKAADIVTPAPGSFLYGSLDGAAASRASRGEHTFFPGFATIALGTLGLTALVLLTVKRRRMSPDERNREHACVPADRLLYLWLLVAAGVASVVLAVGPEAMGVTMPFQIMRDHVPGLDTLRVASRLAVPGLLVMAVLAAVGFASIIRRWRSSIAVLATVVVGGFLLLELAAPLERVDLPTDDATLAVYEALDDKADGAVVELPVIVPQEVRDEWALVEAPRMVYATRDWNPRYNGYSGGLPGSYFVDTPVLNTFPSPAALEVMRRLHIRYAVLHLGTTAGVPQYSEQQAESMLAALPPDAHVERHGNSWLVDLNRSER